MGRIEHQHPTHEEFGGGTPPAKGKKRVHRWNEADTRVLPHAIQKALNNLGIPMPWEEVAKQMNNGQTGGGLSQHVAKEFATLKKDGVKLPSPLKRGGNRHSTPIPRTAPSKVSKTGANHLSQKEFDRRERKRERKLFRKNPTVVQPHETPHPGPRKKGQYTLRCAPFPTISAFAQRDMPFEDLPPFFKPSSPAVVGPAPTPPAMTEEVLPLPAQVDQPLSLPEPVHDNIDPSEPELEHDNIDPSEPELEQQAADRSESESAQDFDNVFGHQPVHGPFNVFEPDPMQEFVNLSDSESVQKNFDFSEPDPMQEFINLSDSESVQENVDLSECEPAEEMDPFVPGYQPESLLDEPDTLPDPNFDFALPEYPYQTTVQDQDSSWVSPWSLTGLSAIMHPTPANPNPANPNPANPNPANPNPANPNPANPNPANPNPANPNPTNPFNWHGNCINPAAFITERDRILFGLGST